MTCQLVVRVPSVLDWQGPRDGQRVFFIHASMLTIIMLTIIMLTIIKAQTAILKNPHSTPPTASCTGRSILGATYKHGSASRRIKMALPSWRR